MLLMWYVCVVRVCDRASPPSSTGPHAAAQPVQLGAAAVRGIAAFAEAFAAANKKKKRKQEEGTKKRLSPVLHGM